jgi:hypothetical protein
MARKLVRFSYQELQSEIRRRQRSVGSLESRRAKLLRKLEELDTRIREMGGANGRPGRSGGGRARNDMTLTGALEKVLSNKTMSVVDAAQAVQKIGYRTNSNNFRTQVNIALIKSGKFKRVGRGQYTAK